MKIGHYNIKCKCGNEDTFTVVNNDKRQGVDIHCNVCGSDNFLRWFIVIDKNSFINPNFKK